MGVSACIICHNEEDLILNCLQWLDSLFNLSEICLIDSYSSDKTWEYITKFKTNKFFKIKQQVFTSFGKQKNDCIDMATQDWILMIDADETYGHKMNKLLGDINNNLLQQYNAFRMDTFTTWPDKKHHIDPHIKDPHIRIWRRGFCKYRGDCHEILWDINNRQMHNSFGKDILNLGQTREYREIILLHHQRLKSLQSLIHKGERWEQLDMLTKSAEQKLPVNKMTWANYKRDLIRGVKGVYPIAKTYWDYQE